MKCASAVVYWDLPKGEPPHAYSRRECLIYSVFSVTILFSLLTLSYQLLLDSLYFRLVIFKGETTFGCV